MVMIFSFDHMTRENRELWESIHVKKSKKDTKFIYSFIPRYHYENPLLIPGMKMKEMYIIGQQFSWIKY